jgi:hypothetical protein
MTELEREQAYEQAREYAEGQGWYWVWADDWDDHTHCGKGYDDGTEYRPETCEYCQLMTHDGTTVLASLSCIDDADDNYRRVIEAELAIEAMAREAK